MSSCTSCGYLSLFGRPKRAAKDIKYLVHSSQLPDVEYVIYLVEQIPCVMVTWSHTWYKSLFLLPLYLNDMPHILQWSLPSLFCEILLLLHLP
jgi:hypothetical protein